MGVSFFHSLIQTLKSKDGRVNGRDTGKEPTCKNSLVQATLRWAPCRNAPGASSTRGALKFTPKHRGLAAGEISPNSPNNRSKKERKLAALTLLARGLRCYSRATTLALHNKAHSASKLCKVELRKPLAASMARRGQLHLQGDGPGRQVPGRSRQLAAAAVHPAPAAGTVQGAGYVRTHPRSDDRPERQ